MESGYLVPLNKKIIVYLYSITIYIFNIYSVRKQIVNKFQYKKKT